MSPRDEDERRGGCKSVVAGGKQSPTVVFMKVKLLVCKTRLIQLSGIGIEPTAYNSIDHGSSKPLSGKRKCHFVGVDIDSSDNTSCWIKKDK